MKSDFEVGMTIGFFVVTALVTLVGIFIGIGFTLGAHYECI